MYPTKTYTVILNNEWYYTGTYEECMKIISDVHYDDNIFQYDIIEVEGEQNA